MALSDTDEGVAGPREPGQRSGGGGRRVPRASGQPPRLPGVHPEPPRLPSRVRPCVAASDLSFYFSTPHLELVPRLEAS